MKGNFWDAASDESKRSSASSTPRRQSVTLRRGAISQTLHKYFGIIIIIVCVTDNTYRQGK